MGQSRRPHERVAHDQLSSLLLRQPLESAADSQEERGAIPTVQQVQRTSAHQPRSARRCGAGRSETFRPTMASPRPLETSARTAGSS